MAGNLGRKQQAIDPRSNKKLQRNLIVPIKFPRSARRPLNLDVLSILTEKVVR